MVEAAVPLDEAGQLIANRYLVEAVLGRGGMATVYRVLDRSDGRHYALKRARSQSAQTLARRQELLEREYHTLAQLAHPSIIAVYSFGHDTHGPFYTMELLDGDDLATLGRGRVPWPRACALLRDVASSLAMLHSRGLLHRDVSARNVRCSDRGLAKLIDFGALCSMGVDLDVVGTPPFVAPEALQMQALDGRVDLFSLGALSYYLLTGSHAFPARQLRDLRDAWRSTPTPPIRIATDIPPALNQLILELLTLDRTARPQSAGEIMRRLCAIAQLPIDEDIAVSRSYLAMPALVGREQAVLTTRRQMLSLARGDGHTLLVEGAAGSGRSRMLDAAVLEGKLLAATVVRAHAVEGMSADWAVARSIVEQLSQLYPDKVEAVTRLSRNALAHVVDEMVPHTLRFPSQRPDSPGGSPSTAPARSLLIRELRDFVLAMALGQRLLIVVDDIDRIDEQSLAFLAALAHKTERHPLMLALSVARAEGPTVSASMRLLQSTATLIELMPFTAEQSEALLRSVFGDVPNQPFVAAHVHRLAQGNARATMELAQHLVERGLCRYQGGNWTLPSFLREHDLPASLSASLEQRLRARNPDALALSEALAITEAPSLASAQLAALTERWPVERVYAALHELVGARVVIADGPHYRFCQRGYVPVLRALMTPERRRELHGRMADLLQLEGVGPLLLAHHLLEAGRDDAALDVVKTLDARLHLPSVELMERAIAHAQARGYPTLDIEELRVNLLSASVFALDVATFRRVATGVLKQLRTDSGLERFDALKHLPEQERLSQALLQTQAAYLIKPVHERGYPLMDAITRLARLSNAFAAMGLWTGDLSVLEAFPDFAPLRSLSVAVEVVCELIEGAKDLQVGRLLRGMERYEAVLRRISEPDGAGLELTQQPLVRTVCLLLLGLIEASAGIARCEERAVQLEADTTFRASAWRLRMLYQLTQGDNEQAHKSLRRAELLQLQAGIERQAQTGDETAMVLTYVRIEDLPGIERAIAQVAPLAELLPHWQPILRLGQSARLRLHGDLDAALDVLLPAFEYAVAGRHRMFGVIAAAHVQLLTELGSVDEAIERGRAYLSIVQLQGLMPGWEIRGALGLALAKANQCQEGLSLIQAWLLDQELVGQTGILMGVACEAAARICLQMNDRAGFDNYAMRCANAYRVEHNRILNARLTRMIGEANGGSHEVSLADHERAAAEAAEATEYETICSRIRECIDGSDRARCALTLLLQQTERYAGHLYGYTGDAGLKHLSGLPEEPAPELTEWARTWFAARAISTTTQAGSEASDLRVSMNPPSSTWDTGEGDSECYTSREGRSYEAWLVTVWEEQQGVTVGALVLQIGSSGRSPNMLVMSQIGSLMLAHRDVQAVPLGRSGDTSTE